MTIPAPAGPSPQPQNGEEANRFSPPLPLPPLLSRPPRQGRKRGQAAMVAASIGTLLIGLAGFVPAARPVLMALWAAANVFAALGAMAWALFHPRALLCRTGGSGAALRWAVVLTCALALLLGAALESVSVRVGPFLPTLPPAVVTVVLFGTAPAAFLFLYAAGLLGAALGVLTAERRNRRRHEAKSGTGAGLPLAPAAATGVGVWWSVVLAGALMGSAGPLSGAGAFTLAGAPALGVAGCALVLSGRLAPLGRVLRRALRFLAHVPVGARRQRRTLDLRGATLGLVAGASALGLAGLRLLQPLQTSWLGAMTQMNNELLAWGAQTARIGDQIRDNDSAAAAARRRQQGPFAPDPAAARIVLLDLDEPTLRALKQPSSSEAAVQARVVQTLAGWGAAQIVLPPPLLSLNASSGGGGAAFRLRPFAPAPNEDDARRSRRDLPALARAARRAPNVLLALDDSPVRTAGGAPAAALKMLRAACAGRVGRADLQNLAGNARVPIVPTRWPAGDPPPAPLLLARRAQQAKPFSSAPLIAPAGPDAVRVAGRDVPLAAPGAILVDFRNSEQAGPDGFTRVRYDSVLFGAPVFVAPSARPGAQNKGDSKGDSGGWRDPRAFFRGKIVFLDALAPRTDETPVGARDRRDVLAHALATLLAQEPLARAGGAPAAWLTLLLAVWVGHLCVRRAPLDALWRTAPFVFGLIALAAVAFPTGWWVDPVAPLAGVLGAFLLATQLTFGMERDARDYQRALLGRFLAPQVVEELLGRDPDEILPLGGKREQVCILFADVRNFTRFAETHTPEQVIEAVNEYITVMTDALHAHRGILDKYTGDGLMALFRSENDVPAGASGPNPAEAPPLRQRALVARAVRAALDMQTAASALSRRRALAGLPTLDVGMGLHVGDAVVGLVGNPDRIVNYTALGYAVVVSARLQTVAKGGEVVVSEAVCGAIEGLFAVEERDPVRVKGVSAPVRPFRILGAHSSDSENVLRPA